MMLITAIVAPSRAVTVKRALGLFGVRGLSESLAFVEVPTGGRVEVYRGSRRVVSMAPRVRLEVLSANADTPDLVRVIARAVTGSDLQLWVTRVDHLVRIRTGEVGLDAL
jgi:nitrogen regulatory protein P-II 1